ncbi:MAG: hypothetical protein H6868_05925 [Rhodospirillales bacterium]|nr:hypothetical protein [Rhodospirillales bacterium]
MSESDFENEGTQDNQPEEERADEGQQVEILHRANRLKLKAGASSLYAGPGFLDPRAVNRAETVIQRKEAAYTIEVEDVLKNLERAWKEALSLPPEETSSVIEELYHYANHVKDLAATFGYELMQHFGYSLRSFASKIDMSKKAHHIIVRAHLDVMWVVYHENIKDHGGPKAEELKKIVAQAIEKYS